MMPRFVLIGLVVLAIGAAVVIANAINHSSDSIYQLTIADGHRLTINADTQQWRIDSR